MRLRFGVAQCKSKWRVFSMLHLYVKPEQMKAVKGLL